MNRNLIIAILVVAIVLAAACVYLVGNQPNEEEGGGSDEDMPLAFDQRSRGIVTPVKNQSPWGTCWAFGGIAAAETSILTLLGMTYDQSKDSDYGAIDLSEKHLSWFSTHAVTELTSKSQAGEGLYNVGEDINPNVTYGIGGDNATYSCLFSMGIGPIYEINFPYKGNTGLTALQAWSDPKLADEMLENECMSTYGMSWTECIQEMRDYGELEDFLENCAELGVKFPDGTTADNLTAEVLKEAMRQQYLGIFSKYNEYSSFDDWTIPESDGAGGNNRSLTSGFVMLDGNILPLPYLTDEEGKWIGLNQKGIETIKNELYLGHGVSFAYHVPEGEEEYFNDSTSAQYTYDNVSSNHIVQMVGWDDNYSRNNFNPAGSLPPGDGAWLCKNSWGSETDCHLGEDGTLYDYGDFGILDENGKHTGYFWISYYDQSMGGIESLWFTNKISTAEGFNSYMYDYMPDDAGTYQIPGAEKGANIFTTENEEDLMAVSVETYWLNTHVKVTVRIIDENSSDPEQGTAVFSYEGDYEFSGYHTILLEKPVHLGAGVSFSIVVEQKCEELDDPNCISIHSGWDEQSAIESELSRYCVGIVNEGESLVYIQGNWIDLVEVVEEAIEDSPGNVYDNLNIKAITLDTPTDA